MELQCRLSGALACLVCQLRREEDARSLRLLPASAQPSTLDPRPLALYSPSDFVFSIPELLSPPYASQGSVGGLGGAGRRKFLLR